MIAIKDMEIPKSCADCERGSICGYGLGYGRANDCPLVEIVTCKDCSIGGRECSNSGKYCIHIGKTTEDDFFCADGERKE